jgi:hypothetical protein
MQWILKYLLPFFLTYCVFGLIYEIIPNKKIHAKSALQAAFFTTLLRGSAKHLFGWYIVHVVDSSMFYGTLGTLVIFVLWLYYSSMIFSLLTGFSPSKMSDLPIDERLRRNNTMHKRPQKEMWDERVQERNEKASIHKGGTNTARTYPWAGVRGFQLYQEHP